MNIEEMFNKLSSKGALVIGVVFALLYYMVAFDDGSKVEQQIVNVKNQMVSTEGDIAKQRRVIREYEQLLLQKESLGDNFSRLVNYIPESFTTNQQMKILSEQAKSAGALVDEIKQSGKGKEFNFFQEVLVEVKLSGTFSQVVLFLSNLTKIDRVIVLKGLSIQKIQKASPSELADELPSVTFVGEFVGLRLTEAKDEEASNSKEN